jgi:hypothetical protein
MSNAVMSLLRGLVLAMIVVWLPCCAPPAKKCAEDRVGNLSACEQACDQNDVPSCVAAARTFDQRFVKEAAASDAERAVALYEKACEAGAIEACFGATRGILLGPSEGNPELPPPSRVDRGPERRRSVLAMGCALEDRRFCMEASDAFLGEDREKSQQLGKKGCALEFADRVKREMCEAERVALALGAQEGATGCESGRPGGCLALGNAIVHADRPRARNAYARECKRRRLDVGGNADACVKVYEDLALARKLPSAEPSISDRPGARVILRSLALDPSRPERPNAEQVRHVVDEGTKTLEGCYAAALRRNPKLAGTLTLRFTVDGLGQPWNVREDDLALVDVETVECVKRSAAAWRFPEPKQETVAVEAKLAFRLERP